MKRSNKLEEIFKKIAEFEKETPYNFCDRWCERCTHEKQMRCKLYQDELEQKITCIAHGREPGDPEITAEVLKSQYEELEKIFEEYEEELDIDFDEEDDPEFEKIKDHIRFVENNPLQKTAEQYHIKTHEFLKETFYGKDSPPLELGPHFETVAWYHTLLPVKLNRALAGLHEPMAEGDISLYDAVAQLEICKKAIKNSVAALRNIAEKDASLCGSITPLSALLQNIFSRIELMEDEI